MSDAPWSQESEQAVLGAMMLNPQATARGMTILQAPSDFYPEAHQVLFAAMQAVYERREPVDAATVGNELQRTGQLEKAGGVAYLLALLTKPPTAMHVERYAQIVAEWALRRQLAGIGSQLASQAQDGAEVADLLDAVSDRLFTLRAGRMAGERSLPISRAIDNFWDWQYKLMGQPFEISGARLGIPNLDRKVGGFADWEVVMFKGEEKFGKTRLLRHSALSTAQAGLPVLVYILEGNLTRWLQGCVAWLAKVPAQLLDRGGLARQSEAQQEQIAKGMGQLPSLPITLASNLRTVQQIQADILACWYSQSPKPVAVYIDYLQLLTEPQANSRVEQIKAALEMFLAVNARTGMPIITASQINKEEQSFYSSEAQHAASLVWQIERGPEGEKLDSIEKRRSDEVRLVNTHKRYGPMIRPHELHADWETGHFYDVDSGYPEHNTPLREHDN